MPAVSGRRDFLKLATASAVILPSVLGWNVSPSYAEDVVMPDIAVKVLQQIAGGSKTVSISCYTPARESKPRTSIYPPLEPPACTLVHALDDAPFHVHFSR